MVEPEYYFKQELDYAAEAKTLEYSAEAKTLEYAAAPTEQMVEPEYSAKSASQDPVLGYYIWRTSSDDRVRPSHAANRGLIFQWSNPPATGHPGKGYGCRCWAEPYAHGELFASIKQRLENLFLKLKIMTSRLIDHCRPSSEKMQLESLIATLSF
jgi:SPP1 gp7 family putative phage head morphogenesis protein